MKRDLLGSAISAGVVTRRGDGSVHYDTNVVCKTSFDNGVTQNGSHGRYAKFSDTRTRPLVGSTDDYSLSLVRATITTNEIPLYIAKPSAQITEGGVTQWECTAQPGLACTWTGPVYSPSNYSVAAQPIGPQTTTDWLYASWPNYGYLPWYIVNTTATGANLYSVASGAINLGALGFASDTLATTVASRLSTALTSATNFTVTVTSPTSVPSTTMSQQYSITFTSTTHTLYFDFTLPPSTTQNRTNGASKEGILQAAKLLGFIPNQTFACTPNVATLFPRAYQLGFRSTINAYCYKNARWVPEESAAPLPSTSDVTNNTPTTYFDCYTYDHFLANVINPTFQRLIWDEYDAGNLIENQCLTRQLQTCITANYNAILPWNSGTSYAVGTSVVYYGQAYVCQAANTSNAPSPTSIYWANCGQSLNYSYIDGAYASYKAGDVVTYCWFSSGSYYVSYEQASATPTGPPLAAQIGSLNNWTVLAAFQFAVGSPGAGVMMANIGTAAPFLTYSGASNLFTFNCDSYGFGGTPLSNVDDGYYGFIDDPLNTSHQYANTALNDIARDSWGITGTSAIATQPYTVARRPFTTFDERFTIEVDDYFHELFGNWPCLRLNYFDPRTQLTTSYVRYILKAQVAGLNVPLPLPLTPTAPVSTGLAATYLPYGRIGGTAQYLYTFAQSAPSVGLMWNPIDAIVVLTGNVPVDPDQTTPPFILDDNGAPVSVQTNGNTLKMLAELNVKPLANTQIGQEYRNEILFDPQFPVVANLQSGRVFDQFDYQIFMRLKATQTLRPLSLSNGGSANLRFVFDRK